MKKIITGIVFIVLSCALHAQDSLPWYQAYHLSLLKKHSSQFNSELIFYTYNRGYKETITLIHGVGGSARDFEHILADLQLNYNLVLVDLPGHGLSPTTHILYSPQGFAETLNQLLPDLVNSKSIVIGHSMGGNVALQYTANNQDKVSSLILIDPAGFLNKFAYSKHLASNQIEGLPLVDKHIPKLKTFIDSVNDYLPDPSKLLLTSLGRKYVLDENAAVISAIALMDENLTTTVRQINVPTLIIWGKDDPVMPYQSLFMLRHTIKQSQVFTIERAGHSPQKQFPALVNKQIDNFLSQDFYVDKRSQKTINDHIEIDCQLGETLDQLSYKKVKNVSIRNCNQAKVEQLTANCILLENSHVSFIDLQANCHNNYALTLKFSSAEVWGGSIYGFIGGYLLDSELDLNAVDLLGENSLILSNRYQKVNASLTQAILNNQVQQWHGLIEVGL